MVKGNLFFAVNEVFGQFHSMRIAVVVAVKSFLHDLKRGSKVRCFAWRYLCGWFVFESYYFYSFVLPLSRFQHAG